MIFTDFEPGQIWYVKFQDNLGGKVTGYGLYQITKVYTKVMPPGKNPPATCGGMLGVRDLVRKVEPADFYFENEEIPSNWRLLEAV